MPHMHLRGKAFRYEATYPDGKNEVLARRAAIRFWLADQLPSSRAEAHAARHAHGLLRASSTTREDNLNNPDPKATVRFGDQTFEEMMIGFFESTLANEDRQDPEQEDQAAVAHRAVQRDHGRHQGRARR